MGSYIPEAVQAVQRRSIVLIMKLKESLIAAPLSAKKAVQYPFRRCRGGAEAVQLFSFKTIKAVQRRCKANLYLIFIQFHRLHRLKQERA